MILDLPFPYMAKWYVQVGVQDSLQHILKSDPRQRRRDREKDRERGSVWAS
jgi:hypothetical protein